MRVIVSSYRNSYEFIHTEDAICMLFIKIKYIYKGYTVFAIPPMWFAKIWYKFTGKGIYKGTNVHFEKVIQGSDQILWHSPYYDY